MFEIVIRLDLQGLNWEAIRRFAVKSFKWAAVGYIIALHIRMMGF